MSKKVVYTRYLIMMVIGTVKIKVKSRFGCIWHGDSKETVLENECAF